MPQAHPGCRAHHTGGKMASLGCILSDGVVAEMLDQAMLVVGS